MAAAATGDGCGYWWRLRPATGLSESLSLVSVAAGLTVAAATTGGGSLSGWANEGSAATGDGCGYWWRLRPATELSESLSLVSVAAGLTVAAATTGGGSLSGWVNEGSASSQTGGCGH